MGKSERKKKGGKKLHFGNRNCLITSSDGMPTHWSFVIRMKIYLAFWICFFSKQRLFGGVERKEKRERKFKCQQ